MIKVENLTNVTRPDAIQGLEFEVGKARSWVFSGPNGAGKTTRCEFWRASCRRLSGRAPSPVRHFEAIAPGACASWLHAGDVPLYNDMRVTEYLDYRGRAQRCAASPRRGARRAT